MSGVTKALFGTGQPDYAPLAAASAEAARLGNELGNRQLDQAQSQFDQSMAFMRPIAERQAAQMDLAYDQGKFAFDRYRNEGVQIQNSMRDMAMGKTPEFVKTQQEEQARKNVADVTTMLDGQRGATNRSMMRMGVNPGSGKFAALQTSSDLNAAAMKAGAANQGRAQAGDRAYARMGDVNNVISGMASSAPGFYQAGTQAGNSAGANFMAPGQNLMQGMSAGNGTIMQGQGMRLQGMGNVLQAQGNTYGQNLGMLGTLAGMGGAALLSDPRLKENIKLVGKYDNGLNKYHFNYINSDGKTLEGVMADEVEPLYPDAVVYDDLGFASVNYAMLGIEMKEVE